MYQLNKSNTNRQSNLFWPDVLFVHPKPYTYECTVNFLIPIIPMTDAPRPQLYSTCQMGCEVAPASVSWTPSLLNGLPGCQPIQNSARFVYFCCDSECAVNDMIEYKMYFWHYARFLVLCLTLRTLGLKEYLTWVQKLSWCCLACWTVPNSTISCQSWNTKPWRIWHEWIFWLV